MLRQYLSMFSIASELPARTHFIHTPNYLQMNSINITTHISLLWMAKNTSTKEEHMQAERFKYILLCLVRIVFKFELISLVLFVVSLVLEACATLRVHWRAQPRMMCIVAKHWQIESLRGCGAPGLIGLRRPLSPIWWRLSLLVWTFALRSYKAQQMLGRV